MKFILSEKYILNEAENGDVNPMNITFDSDNNMDIAANLDDNDTFDFKAELESAEKSGNKELAEAIWDKFYTKFSKESGISVESLKNLGVAFRVECLNLGFTEASNVFLQFLKRHKDLVSSMNSQTYGALHNCYSSNEGGMGYITKADLLGEANRLGDLNLIFNPDLYTKPAQDVIKYLKLQNLTINAFKNNLDIEKYNTAEEAINNIFISGGKLNPVNKIEEQLRAIGIISDNNQIIKLSSTDDVKALLDTQFKDFIAAGDKASIAQAMVLLISAGYKNAGEKTAALEKYKLTTSPLLKNVDAAKLPDIIKAVTGITAQNSNTGILDKLLDALGEKIK